MEGNETNIQTPAPEPNVDSINWGKEIFEWVACFVIAIVIGFAIAIDIAIVIAIVIGITCMHLLRF